ncbi:PDDEXK nuclease domain-containing protein [Chitinophaga vietnamensis]|uniref:PDDEXK nuclease domain-containing protein n=1 Tax=Chitinophaga vietnamensis TaxID=2593957 RepID=UPI00117849EA|nr:PDDEXK nuclease domain-containing protein [Chitinophaga vietnamensis]
MKFNTLVNTIEATHVRFQQTAAKAVNRSLTLRNWLIGYYIVEYEQSGQDRAKYRDNLMIKITEKLSHLKMSETNLKLFRQFYLYYPQIHELVRDKLKNSAIQIRQSLTDEFQNANSQEIASINPLQVPANKIVDNLSFTHITCLLTIKDQLQRTFYELECMKANWSVRELKRQIGSLYFERMGLAQDPEKLSRLIQQRTASPVVPSDFIKNVYTFEFLDIPQKILGEENLVQEQLLNHLQDFLLEMGHGFCLEGRQKRILIGPEYYFIDIVFYHRILRCHILIELKVGDFTTADAGQLTTYLNFFKAKMMEPGDNPPIGILLVTNKNESLVEFAIPAGMDQQLFVSRYAVQLPTKKQLEHFLAEELRRCNL